MAGPLESMNNPAAAMVPGASGGNPMIAELMQSMISGAQQRQGYLEQQQEAYNADLNKYAGMVAQSQTPEANEASKWGAMANAAAKSPGGWEGTGAMLANVGAAYGENQALQQQLNLKNQGELTKTRQAEVKAMEASKQNSDLMKTIYGKKGSASPVVKVVDGKLVKYDPITDTTEVLTGSQDQIKAKMFQSFYTKAVANEHPNPEQYAMEQTEKTLGQFGGTTVAGKTNAIPGVSSSREEVVAPEMVEDSVEGKPTFSFDVSRMSPDDKEIVKRVIARYQANPNEGTKAQTIKLLSGMFDSGSIVQRETPKPQPQSLTYLDKPKKEAEIESSKAGAKMYGESFETDVLKPLQAFQDTGRIMQDFNNLGQMNAALKNGKLKEFMAGETGKWAMSLLPESSDMRKGIANAQEAEKLTAGMVNKILLAAKGIQTEGDANRARSQVTSIGMDPEANKYVEAYMNETARQLKLREQSGLAHKSSTGNWEGYDQAWQSSPIMKEAKGSVKKLGNSWIGLTQYIDKFKGKNQGATDSDAIASWNKVK